MPGIASRRPNVFSHYGPPSYGSGGSSYWYGPRHASSWTALPEAERWNVENWSDALAGGSAGAAYNVPSASGAPDPRGRSSPRQPLLSSGPAPSFFHRPVTPLRRWQNVALTQPGSVRRWGRPSRQPRRAARLSACLNSSREARAKRGTGERILLCPSRPPSS